MIIGSAYNVKKVRQGSKKLFYTAALELHNYPTAEDVLRGAFTALENGADAIFTPRNTEVIEMLSNEDIPVMGHLGLVPRKSSWFGGLRAIGKTPKEAYELFQKFKDLENAGASHVGNIFLYILLGTIGARADIMQVTDLPIYKRAIDFGLSIVPQTGGVFSNLTCIENCPVLSRRSKVSLKSSKFKTRCFTVLFKVTPFAGNIEHVINHGIAKPR